MAQPLDSQATSSQPPLESAFGPSQQPGAAGEGTAGRPAPASPPPPAGSGLASLGTRRRLLFAAALLGCLGLFALARWLAGSAVLVLPPGVAPAAVQALSAAAGPTTTPLPVSAALWLPPSRWLASAELRQRAIAEQHLALGLLAQGPVRLHLRDGHVVDARSEPRGWRGLGAAFWPLAGGALLLYLLALAVVLARPHGRNAAYLVLALLQCTQLLALAMLALPGVGPPLAWLLQALPWLLAAELLAVALLVQVLAWHPQPLRGAGTPALSAACWALALAAAWGLAQAQPVAPFGWAQACLVALGAAAAWRAWRSWQRQPDPTALMLKRLLGTALTLLLLLSAAVSLAASRPAWAQTGALAAPLAWHGVLFALLVLVPLMARSRYVVREFALLAGISAVATSLDLLFVSLFALGPFTSLALAVFLALALYGGLRQWLLSRLLGQRIVSVERLFERLYRVAREVQAQPTSTARRLRELLQEVFDPLDVVLVDRALAASRVQRGGAALLVPLRPGPPAPTDSPDSPAPRALQLRYAQRGRRLFTPDDARLADRVLEQLRRAVAYDAAVERGRSEERLRIAQDLHDDIGARLLTLMYQAPNPEMEDYIRHTLQDLKTLTRGLAAAEHRLSHAAAEWKADLASRLQGARAVLAWDFEADCEVLLTVVQWSALTRVLRELVSNALFHGHASRLAVALRLHAGTLSLSVADNGEGAAPQQWAHGLGLGGIRKRVRQLGGSVAWREGDAGGIVCEARFPGFAASPDGP